MLSLNIPVPVPLPFPFSETRTFDSPNTSQQKKLIFVNFQQCTMATGGARESIIALQGFLCGSGSGAAATARPVLLTTKLRALAKGVLSTMDTVGTVAAGLGDPATDRATLALGALPVFLELVRGRIADATTTTDDLEALRAGLCTLGGLLDKDLVRARAPAHDRLVDVDHKSPGVAAVRCLVLAVVVARQKLLCEQGTHPLAWGHFVEAVRIDCSTDVQLHTTLHGVRILGAGHDAVVCPLALACLDLALGLIVDTVHDHLDAVVRERVAPSYHDLRDLATVVAAAVTGGACCGPLVATCLRKDGAPDHLHCLNLVRVADHPEHVAARRAVSAGKLQALAAAVLHATVTHARATTIEQLETRDVATLFAHPCLVQSRVVGSALAAFLTRRTKYGPDPHRLFVPHKMGQCLLAWLGTKHPAKIHYLGTPSAFWHTCQKLLHPLAWARVRAALLNAFRGDLQWRRETIGVDAEERPLPLSHPDHGRTEAVKSQRRLAYAACLEHLALIEECADLVAAEHVAAAAAADAASFCATAPAAKRLCVHGAV